MNKSKNSCLGRRGRPKKNQQKPSLNECIAALLEIEEFSIFPLDKSEFKNESIANMNVQVNFKNFFKNWYNLNNCIFDKKDLMEIETEIIDREDKRRIFLNNETQELNILVNTGTFTSSKFMPHIIFVKGHIWKMAFSPPIMSLKKIYLSVGIYPLNSPVSQINKRYKGLGVIQIWEIPFINENEETSSPTLLYEILHNGLICRFLEWIPLSGNLDSNIIGLMFCILGDGNAYILSIPFKNMSKKINIEDIIIWKYSESFTVCSGSICIPDEGILRIAGTTVEGILLIWTFETNFGNDFKFLKSKVNDINGGINDIIASEQLIPISQNIPLLSASWCPVYSSNLVVVGDGNGKVSIIDFRRCNNHIIKEFELPNRPITCIVWCRLTNNIYISHGIGAIVLSIENGDYTQFSIENFIKKRKYSVYENMKSPILGSRSWTCSSMVHYAIFGFNDGSTIIGPCFEFESKSFQETLLIKAIVVDSNINNKNSLSNNNLKDNSQVTNDCITTDCGTKDCDLFNNMKDLILKDFNERINRMKSSSIKIIWEHDLNNTNIVDFLEVQCITSVDPFLYPQLIDQPFTAIAYFGGIIVIHRFN